MKNVSVLVLSVAAALVTLVNAEMPPADGPPTLVFRTIPVEGAPTLAHTVTPYRIFNKMIVTVWDPIYCGQKPSNPTFSIQGEKLLLSYDLSPAPSDGKRCTLISEFDVDNVPHRDLDVHFAGGPEPYVIAKLQKCPNYSPASQDIWECLAPSKR